MKLQKICFSVIFILIFILTSGMSFADEERHKTQKNLRSPSQI